MDKYEAMLKLLEEAIQANKAGMTAQKQPAGDEIPVGISNRHVHLSQQDLETLFGCDCQLSQMKDLSQPGQFACKETVTICGPKGAIEKVRILGPVRPQSQVEILTGDCIKLGIPSVVRISGDLAGSPGLTIIGPKGSVQLKEGAIVALRHIHMTLEDAQRLGVRDGQSVDIEFSGERGGIYKNVAVRANNTSALECHLDIEEANAMNMNSLSKITIKK